MPDAETISVVIPTLDEASGLAIVLDALRSLPGCREVIVADGGSRDRTLEIARERGARVVCAARPGRGAQMREGALVARGSVLWFLHADTIPPPGADAAIIESLRDPAVVGGNCRLRFDGGRRAASFLTWLYPRLRRIGLIYGDSGIFVRRDVYEACGGFRDYPIFEDLDLVARVRRHGRMTRPDVTLVTSSRRFADRSFAWTFARWAGLQILFWIGVDPHRLGRRYAPIRLRSDHDACGSSER